VSNKKLYVSLAYIKKLKTIAASSLIFSPDEEGQG